MTVTNPNGLNIRYGPGTNNPRVDGVDGGTVVTSAAIAGPHPSPNQVQDKQGNWWDFIQTNDGTAGWMEVQSAGGSVYATIDTTPGGTPPSNQPGGISPSNQPGGTTPTPTGSAANQLTPKQAATFLLDQGNYSPYSRGQGKPVFDPNLQAQDFARTLYKYEQNQGTGTKNIQALLGDLGPQKAATLFLHAANLPGWQTTTQTSPQRFNVDNTLSTALSVPGVLGDSTTKTGLAYQLIQQGAANPTDAKNLSLVIPNVTGTSTQVTSLHHDFVNALLPKALGQPTGTLSNYLDMRTYARAALRIVNADTTVVLTPQQKQELGIVAQFSSKDYQNGLQAGQGQAPPQAKFNASYAAGYLQGAGALNINLLFEDKTNGLQLLGQQLSAAFPLLPPSYLKSLVASAASGGTSANNLAMAIGDMTLGQHRLGNDLLAQLATSKSVPWGARLGSLTLLSEVSGLNSTQANQALEKSLLNDNSFNQFLLTNTDGNFLPAGAADLLAKAVANYGGGPHGLLYYLANPKNNYGTPTTGLEGGGLALARLFESTIFNSWVNKLDPHTHLYTHKNIAAMMNTVGQYVAFARRDMLHTMIVNHSLSTTDNQGQYLQNMAIGLANGFGLANAQAKADAAANKRTVDAVLGGLTAVAPLFPLGSIMQDLGTVGTSNTIRGIWNQGPVGATRAGQLIYDTFSQSSSIPTNGALMTILQKYFIGFGTEWSTMTNGVSKNGSYDPKALQTAVDSLNQHLGYNGQPSGWNSNEFYTTLTPKELQNFLIRYRDNSANGQDDPFLAALIKPFNQIISGSNLGLYQPIRG
ncbi:MAG: SH3 domain-containing protein [Methylacidiphilaceae bacterium]|nr:SH3 domain-containing protein [Candidatus Methylacidiphilaceae bacterium]